MRDDEFEWDDRKAAQNVAKHKISFALARLAFDDPHSIERPDDSQVYDEDRMELLGFVKGRLLHVTFVYRNDRIRIVSARGAEAHEQRRYHEEKG